MTRLLLGILLILIAKVGNGQSISTSMGGRAAGMGFASSALSDEWSLFNNPGSLGQQNQITAAAAYEIRPDLLTTNRLVFNFQTPLKWGALAAGVFRFGDDLYNEQIISAGYGNKLGIATLGLKVSYVQYRAEGFQTTGAVSLDFGGLVKLTDHLLVGAYITNLTQSSYHTEGGYENLPTRLTAGITYTPSKSLLITTELDKDIDYEAIWRTGLEYSYKEKIFFRTGFNLNPQAAFAGLGGRTKKIKADYAITFNPYSGMAHHVSVNYFVSKSKK